MATNLVTYYVNSTARTARAGEVPLADFADSGGISGEDGCNDAGSNSPGIGVNTGYHSPSTSSWSQAAADERM